MKISEHQVLHGNDTDDRTVRLLLSDYHYEYTGVWDDRVPYADGYARARMVWEVNEMGDSFGPEAAYAAWAALQTGLEGLVGKERAADLDGENCYIWALEGNLKGLEVLFGRLERALAERPPSGDDDCFDYWPNSMDILWELGTDLDEWIGEGFRDRARMVVKHIADQIAARGNWNPYTEEWTGREWIAGLEEG